MNLPIPTDAEVADFKVIYDREHGTDLDPDQAREAATLVLQLHCLVKYGPTMSRREDAARAAAPAPARTRRPPKGIASRPK